MTTTVDDREAARYHQDVLRSYRLWLAYLEAHQTLVDHAGDSAADADLFEGASAGQERASAARRRLATLPSEQRALFDAVAAQMRTQVQQELDAQAPVRGSTVKRADSDAVARQALAKLHDLARGVGRDDRRGLVPRGKPDAVKWLGIDLAVLEQAPPSVTDYELVQGRANKRRGLVTNLLLAALALVAIPLVVLLLQPRAAGSDPTGAAISDGAALRPWRITALAAADGDWRLPVTTSGAQWDAVCATAEAASACWLEDSFRPILLCLSATELAAVPATLELAAAGGQPMRTFALSEEPDPAADLVLRPCSTRDGDVSPRYGQLRALHATPDLAVGVAAPAAGFHVEAITVRGRGEDPEIPADLMAVLVVVHADDDQEWVDRSPTLLLADGTQQLASETVRAGATVRFRYLVAEQREPTDVVWQAALDADAVVRYRATLSPPAARDQVLRAALAVRDLVVTPLQQTMRVRLRLVNLGATPLVVVAGDLGYVTPQGRRDVAAPELQQPIAPDDSRSIELTLPLESGVLTIGPLRYQLTVQR